MTTTYYAKSLDDIAQAFDRQANTARETAARAKTKREKRDAEVEANTWTIAANVLRNTRLMQP